MRYKYYEILSLTIQTNPKLLKATLASNLYSFYPKSQFCRSFSSFSIIPNAAEFNYFPSFQTAPLDCWKVEVPNKHSKDMKTYFSRKKEIVTLPVVSSMHNLIHQLTKIREKCDCKILTIWLAIPRYGGSMVMAKDKSSCGLDVSQMKKIPTVMFFYTLKSGSWICCHPSCTSQPINLQETDRLCQKIFKVPDNSNYEVTSG